MRKSNNDDDDVKVKDKDEEEEDEEKGPEKAAGTLSDSVLDAFEPEEVVDPLLAKEDELVDIDKIIEEEDEDDLDYNPDEW